MIGFKGLFNLCREYVFKLKSWRSGLSDAAFAFDFKIMDYIRKPHRQIYNDFLMKLSAWRLRLFAAKTVPEKYLALGRNTWMQGKHKKALRHFRIGEAVRKKLVVKYHWQDKNFIMLPRNCAHVIGLMGHLDGFIKRKILNQDSRTYYLLAPKNEIVNQCFLEYWSSYIKIITDQDEINTLAKYEPAFTVNWNWAILENDRMLHVHHALAKAQKRWYSENRAPLLKLTAEHQALLVNQKQAWGMQDDDWFVCLHVRSAGYYQKQDGNTQEFRNTAISDYYPLIDAITAEGGWVMRMGDASTELLDKAQLKYPQRVIDYAHSAERSVVLDVVLSASCRLFISSPSGLHLVAKAFGRPAFYINFPLYRGFPHDPNSIFIPPFYYSKAKKRQLKLKEILASNLVHADHQCHLDRSQVAIQPVSPEDIVLAAREVLSVIEHDNFILNDGSGVVEFDHFNQKYATFINGRISQVFLAKHSAILD
ncbi:MAG: TIGR04372 family glycosyltransferase [Gammaproteobacteria bacterium]|nr:TIGR04372 family glycosyltransferase [Gammaproteobacteria bacterium]